MAVTVALTTQYPCCIEIHATAARESVAADEMLAETATVASPFAREAAVTHRCHLFPG